MDVEVSFDAPELFFAIVAAVIAVVIGVFLSFAGVSPFSVDHTFVEIR